jgi:hypothetical protein
MENRHRRTGPHGGEDGRAITDISRDVPHARIRRWPRERRIQQHDLAQFLCRAGRPDKSAEIQELFAKLGAKESASTGDDDFHECED